MLIYLASPYRVGHDLKDLRNIDIAGSPVVHLLKHGSGIRATHLEGCEEDRFTLMFQFQAVWRVLSLQHDRVADVKKARLR